MERQRNLTIDVMKGIGILLVITGHISKNQQINSWIYSFHMPLFFFISGITCYMSNKKDFIKRKFKSLIIPYLIFSIITFAYWALIERQIRPSDSSIIGQFLNIFIAQAGSEHYIYNVVMWFLPCLFMTEVIFYFLRKNIHDDRVIYILIIASAILGYGISKYVNIRLPFCLDSTLVAIPFYGVGYFLANNIELIQSKLNKKNTAISIAIFSVLSIFIAYLYNGCDMNNNTYSNYILFYILAFIGIAFTFTVSNTLNLSILRFIGVNSLIIMCIHEPIKRILIKIVSVVTKIDINILRQEFIWIGICSILLLLITFTAVYIINKYLPFMIGKKLIKQK